MFYNMVTTNFNRSLVFEVLMDTILNEHEIYFTCVDTLMDNNTSVRMYTLEGDESFNMIMRYNSCLSAVRNILEGFRGANVKARKVVANIDGVEGIIEEIVDTLNGMMLYLDNNYGQLRLEYGDWLVDALIIYLSMVDASDFSSLNEESMMEYFKEFLTFIMLCGNAEAVFFVMVTDNLDYEVCDLQIDVLDEFLSLIKIPTLCRNSIFTLFDLLKSLATQILQDDYNKGFVVKEINNDINTIVYDVV